MMYKDIQRRKEYSKRYYQEHKEKIDKANKRYNKQHRELMRKISEKYRKKHRSKVRETARKSMELPHSKFLTYKKDARRRNFPFEFTEEQFMTFWQKPCFYCGAEIPTIGLDRIDNTQGYTKDNIVSCCSICNRMKMNLPLDVFIEQCHKVANKNL